MKIHHLLLVALLGVTGTGCSRETERYASPSPPQQTADPDDDDPGEGEAPAADPLAASAKPMPANLAALECKGGAFRLAEVESEHEGMKGRYTVPQYCRKGLWVAEGAKRGHWVNDYVALTTPDALETRLAALPRPPSIRPLLEICVYEEGTCFSPSTHVCGEEGEEVKVEKGKCKAAQLCCPQGHGVEAKPKPAKPAAKAEADDDSEPEARPDPPPPLPPARAVVRPPHPEAGRAVEIEAAP